MKDCILVVDDDPNICELVKVYLEEEFHVEILHDGSNVMNLIKTFNPVLVILDVMLPVKDGFQICREIREGMSIPVIMLTAKGEETDRILGLELGADDYIIKPFSPREVAARVKAVLRRLKHVESSGDVLRFPGIVINSENHVVTVNNQSIDLTAKEFELLWFLASNHGKVYTREMLLDKIWGYDYFGDARAVDSQIKRLRKKLESVKDSRSYVHTVWGVGYKFEVL